MNGRIYDPVLKGFMSPDNFIHEGSQGMNRYAYCMNNPLMYTDPSGEEPVTIGLGLAVAIGAAIAATSYTIYALATTWDNFSWGGLLKSTLIGAVSGVASFGVGQLASQMFTGICASTSTLTASQVSWIVAAPQAVMHGISQGFIAGISGGDLGQAFFSAMISSGVSSVVQMGGSSFMGNGDAATLLFGTVSGGLSAELTGGNFWEGAAIGLTVSGLNHLMHKINTSVQNGKRIVAGIYGAGGSDAGGNPRFEQIVKDRGGEMFTSSWGGGDQEIIDYLAEGYNNGKNIEIFGYSRGGNAAVRVTNALGAMGIDVSLLVTFDPHSLDGGSFQLLYNNVGSAMNFYQQNIQTSIFGDNPYIGQAVYSNYINVKNHNFNGTVFPNSTINVGHINIIRYVRQHYNYGFLK